MKITGKIILVISHAVVFLFVLNIFKCNASDKKEFLPIDKLVQSSEEFQAVNDTFYFVTNCTDVVFIDNVLKNDIIQESDNVQLCYIFAPKAGILTFGSNGNFMLTLPEGYSGTLEFSYSLCNKKGNTTSKANVIILVENDNDCDGIINYLDLDNDNDGILDTDEGNGFIDSDDDGLPDNFDIDADNDGISDNEEWQKEGEFIFPLEADVNKNGWDDAYDPEMGGIYYKPVDTDNNGIPDYIDTDSDRDGIFDIIEAFETDYDEEFQIIDLMHIDSDNDGLDDVFDVISCWSLGCNSTGSSAPLPDLNKNGIREWRDYSDIYADENLTQHTDFYVYPNPSTGIINIDNSILNDKTETLLRMITMQGIIIENILIPPGSDQIDLRNITPGNYILQLISDKGKVQTKITLQ